MTAYHLDVFALHSAESLLRYSSVRGFTRPSSSHDRDIACCSQSHSPTSAVSLAHASHFRLPRAKPFFKLAYAQSPSSSSSQPCKAACMNVHRKWYLMLYTGVCESSTTTCESPKTLLLAFPAVITLNANPYADAIRYMIPSPCRQRSSLGCIILIAEPRDELDFPTSLISMPTFYSGTFFPAKAGGPVPLRARLSRSLRPPSGTLILNGRLPLSKRPLVARSHSL